MNTRRRMDRPNLCENSCFEDGTSFCSTVPQETENSSFNLRSTNNSDNSRFTQWWFSSDFSMFLQGMPYVWWIGSIGLTFAGAYQGDPLCWSLIAYFVAGTAFIYGSKALNKKAEFKIDRGDGFHQRILFTYIILMEAYAVHPVVSIVDFLSLSKFFGYLLAGFAIALFCILAINKAVGLKFKSKVGFYAYFALVAYYVVNPVVPVFAQNTVEEVAACNTAGLLGNLGSFTINLFSSIQFGSVAGSDFSSLICQVIGLLVVGLLVVFIGLFGYVMYQVNIQQQPYSVAIQPILGFVTFAGSTALAIQVMIGDGTIDGGGGSGGGDADAPVDGGGDL